MLPVHAVEVNFLFAVRHGTNLLSLLISNRAVLRPRTHAVGKCRLCQPAGQRRHPLRRQAGRLVTMAAGPQIRRAVTLATPMWFRYPFRPALPSRHCFSDLLNG